MPRKNRTSGKKLALAERRYLAVELRKQGGTYRQIAEQLRTNVPGISPGYDEAAAWRDVNHELERLVKETRDRQAALRQLELERIDTMHQAIWPFAEKGDGAAIDRVLRLQDQRAKYLTLFPRETKAAQTTVTMGDGTTAQQGPPAIKEVVVNLTMDDPRHDQQPDPDLPPDADDEGDEDEGDEDGDYQG